MGTIDVCCEIECGALACEYCGACRTEHSEDPVTDCPEKSPYRWVTPKHKTTTLCKHIQQLQAEIDKIKLASDELLAAFPDEIPPDCEDVEFNIPAYLVRNLNQALKGE